MLTLTASFGIDDLVANDIQILEMPHLLRKRHLSYRALEDTRWRRLLKSLRRVLTGKVEAPISLEDIPQEDLDLFHAICLAWSEGPMARRYLARRHPSVAPYAAHEIRLAIECHEDAQQEHVQDHIALLWRLESKLGSESQGFAEEAAAYLAQVLLAKARPWLRSIRAALPWRSQSD